MDTCANRRGNQMWDTTTDVALAVPPATVAVLTVMGVSVADAVSAVMLIWAVALLAEKVWSFARWVHRRGWNDWHED